MSELQKKLDLLKSKVDEMRRVVFSNLVDWSQVTNIAVGETFTVEDTFNTKLYEDENCMLFRTVIPVGVTFPYHLHDFLEQNLMLKGELKDISKTYKKTDWMVYEPFVGHEITNTSNEDAVIIVIFTR